MAEFKRKSLYTAFLLWFFLGLFGAHRFYLRRYGTAVLWLFTGGVCGIGWFVDLFCMNCLLRGTNRRLEEEATRAVYQVVAPPQIQIVPGASPVQVGEVQMGGMQASPVQMASPPVRASAMQMGPGPSPSLVVNMNANGAPGPAGPPPYNPMM